MKMARYWFACTFVIFFFQHHDVRESQFWSCFSYVAFCVVYGLCCRSHITLSPRCDPHLLSMVWPILPEGGGGFIAPHHECGSWGFYTFIEKDLGGWSPEEDCCWWLTFRHPLRKPSSESAEEGFRTGCRNVSHQQQSFPGLQPPRWSFSITLCYSLVQTIFLLRFLCTWSTHSMTVGDILKKKTKQTNKTLFEVNQGWGIILAGEFVKGTNL